MSSRFVSFSDLPEALEVESESNAGPVPILWDMELPPHVDLEKLQINVPRLRTMHRIGAITASLVRAYEGEITESTPNIVGINPDGSAIAGKSGVTKKQKKSKQTLSELGKDPADFGWTVMEHKINRPEAADMVVERTSKGQSSEQAWSEVLDGILRQSLRKGGKKHLTQRVPNLYKSVPYLLGGGMLVNSTVYALQGEALGTGIGLVSYAGLQAYPSLQKRIFQSDYTKRRWSIMPYWGQPDRYFALNALSRAPGLVNVKK